MGKRASTDVIIIHTRKYVGKRASTDVIIIHKRKGARKRTLGGGKKKKKRKGWSHSAIAVSPDKAPFGRIINEEH